MKVSLLTTVALVGMVEVAEARPVVPKKDCKKDDGTMPIDPSAILDGFIPDYDQLRSGASPEYNPDTDSDSDGDPDGDDELHPCAGPVVTCTLSPTETPDLEGDASAVAGTIDFAPIWLGDIEMCATHMNGTISGLQDDTPHGWHIHQWGVLTADGKGTGGHYDPFGVMHALPELPYGQNERHVGDLGNLLPDEAGTVEVDLSLVNLDTSTVAGRGLIIHAKEDDGGQPTGNAGGRIGQCILGIKMDSL